MKRVFLHCKRVFAKFWFIILLSCSISPIIGLGVFIAMTAFSMAFFSDPIDVKAEVEDLLNNFTEEELGVIFAEKVDENVSDDDYLTLVAKYQSYICDNKKIDEITTWTGSEVNKEAFIYLYELNDKKIEGFDIDKQKEAIRKSISKDHVQTYRIINSGRALIFRYTYRYSGQTMDVVFSNEELKNC